MYEIIDLPISRTKQEYGTQGHFMTVFPFFIHLDYGVTQARYMYKAKQRT